MRRAHGPDVAKHASTFARAAGRVMIGRALALGAGLKEITRAAAETAIRIALEEEQDNVHRAALRLGLTDRAVQLRRAGNRQLH